MVVTNIRAHRCVRAHAALLVSHVEVHKQILLLTTSSQDAVRAADPNPNFRHSFPAPIHDEFPFDRVLKPFGHRRELETSTKFAVRKREKSRQHWTSHQRKLLEGICVTAQIIESSR
jgi:hypothetical protein